MVVDSSEEFSPTLLSNISVSIISQFLREVEPIPPEGVSMDSCLYQISVSKEQDTTFVTFKGKNLNSYGDSKLSGTDGFQQSLLKSLYRSLEDKRKKICEDYGELLKKCGSVVVQDVPKQVEPKVVKTNESIKIISLVSFVGVINNFIRLDITLRLLKTNDYKIVNKKFVLNVLEYKNKDPEGILLVFDNVNFESIKDKKLRDCANKYKMHWLLAKEDDGREILKFPAHNINLIPVSECFMSKLDPVDSKSIKNIIRNFDKIINEGFVYGKPIFDKSPYSPPLEYWKVQTEDEKSFWDRIAKFIINHSKILFLE